MSYGFNQGDVVTVIQTGKLLEVVGGPHESAPASAFISTSGARDGSQTHAVWALDRETRQIAVYLSGDLEHVGKR